MANNITTNATFATANMKPVPDEQIDALWGQNASDNAGYLFYKEEVIPRILDTSGASGSSFFAFTKKPGKAGLKFFAYGLGAAAMDSWYARVHTEGNGTALVATRVWGINSAAGSFYRFDVDISSLTNYTNYVVRLTKPGDVTDAVAWQTYGSGAAY